MHILIPAGGRGVRLAPLTDRTPKPLLPLGDRPILTHILDRLPPQVPVTLVVSPETRDAFEAWRRGLTTTRVVSIYVETHRAGRPRGPVIALADCIQEQAITGDLVVMMGDSILPFTLSDFLGQNGSDTLTLAAYRLPSLRDARRFGVLEFSADGWVTTFEEKPEHPRAPWVYTGCLFVPGRLLAEIVRLGETCAGQMGYLVGRFLEDGERIRVFQVTEEWHDIGTFESYLRAHKALLPEAQRRVLAERGNQLEGMVYVHPSASVSRSRLQNCLVFEGATVLDAALSDCVVQPNVSVLAREAQQQVIGLLGDQPIYSTR
jgi:NDP-sugar pyrophosphorylase family protein